MMSFQENFDERLSGWSGALIATGLISLLPNLLLFLLPSSIFATERKSKQLNVSNILLAFAVAGLLGDVFLHILPHMLVPHDHHHGHDHHQHDHTSHNTHVMTLNDHDNHHDGEDHAHKDEHAHEHSQHHHHEHDGHHHHDEHSAPSESILSSHQTIYQILGVERNLCIQVMVLMGFLIFFVAERLAKSKLGQHSHACHVSHKKNDDIDDKVHNKAINWKDKLSSSGWLNLLADTMHNFTDGIAIGASFASGKGLALATFISVILHEIPHEIGDFTILINNGLSKSEAIKAQFLTALGAFAGTIVGLSAERNPIFEDLFLAFTSGGFIYIATVGALPQILAEENSGMQIVCEIIAFITGIAMMVAVTYFE